MQQVRLMIGPPSLQQAEGAVAAVLHAILQQPDSLMQAMVVAGGIKAQGKVSSSGWRTQSVRDRDARRATAVLNAGPSAAETRIYPSKRRISPRPQGFQAAGSHAGGVDLSPDNLCSPPGRGRTSPPCFAVVGNGVPVLRVVQGRRGRPGSRAGTPKARRRAQRRTARPTEEDRSDRWASASARASPRSPRCVEKRADRKRIMDAGRHGVHHGG
jgi:hypothetical protein